jgi:hypothetical protein
MAKGGRDSSNQSRRNRESDRADSRNDLKPGAKEKVERLLRTVLILVELLQRKAVKS